MLASSLFNTLNVNVVATEVSIGVFLFKVALSRNRTKLNGRQDEMRRNDTTGDEVGAGGAASGGGSTEPSYLLFGSDYAFFRIYKINLSIKAH